jgi:iron complex transport system substrate-binding protein
MDLHKKILFMILAAWLPAAAASCSWARTPMPPVQQVISLSPFITETIYLLGAQDKLVANTTYCNIPPQAAQKEKIGSVTQVNVEKIISLRPDLVIASALTRTKQILILKNQGIRIMEIANPVTFDQICDLTLKIGQTLGHQGRAAKIVADTRAKIQAIRDRVQNFAARRVFIQIGLKPLHTANKEMFINSIIETAGGINIAQDLPSGIYSRERVIQENPDLIFIATMGSSKKAGLLEKKRWMQFSSLNAARNHEIHVLNPDIVCSPTPVSFAEGVGRVADLIHPASADPPPSLEGETP